MDRIKSASTAIEALHKYNNKKITDFELITKICEYYDLMKNQTLSEADKKLLLLLANKVGIPHYYDMLFNEFKTTSESDIENIDLTTFTSLLYESTLFTDEKFKIHRYQKDVLEKFSFGKQNRYFLSASTSFGKTFLVYEIIKKMNYKNVVLIFPTIALLSENLEKIKENMDYLFFQKKYSTHTLSDVNNNISDYNIFIYTPERFLSYLDRYKNKIDIDFVFVDEVYKIDNEYLIEEELKESERDLSYRLALFYALTNFKNIDALLAGPYINFYNKNDPKYNPSFDLFLKDFNIELINKNNYEIVNKKQILLSETQRGIIVDDNLSFDFQKKLSKSNRLQVIINEIIKNGENAIVYCYSRASSESNALKISLSKVFDGYDYSKYETLINHLEDKYDKEWVVIKALKKGIGVHHGLIPKYIQKEIIRLFNDNLIKLLFSTTTITEGVNTTAKNMIAFNCKKGSKKYLKPFDAKNIAGRAGRFYKHYSGRVIALEDKFIQILNKEEEGIRHKNYDKNSNKNNSDTEITKDEYLTDQERENRDEIKRIQNELGIPEEIISQFKIISREDKILIYKRITNLSISDHASISNLVRKLQFTNPKIDFDGFQIILIILKPIIQDKTINFYIDREKISSLNQIKYSNLVYLINFYLKDNGFESLYESNLKYNIKNTKENERDEKRGKNVDKAMRDTSMLIYNTFKYQLVKYLGIFNIMYKYERAKSQNTEFENILGIDRLLSKLEYNAFSPEARLANDYGVPYNVVRYFDIDIDKRESINFDNFEKNSLENFRKIL